MISIKFIVSLAVIATTAFAQPYKIDPASLVNIRCNDSDKLPTPSYGSTGIVFTVCAEQEINAPIDKVYNALLDFGAYSIWNTFVIDVVARGKSSLTPAPAPVGTQMTFTVAGLIGPLNVPTPEIVSVGIPDVDGDGKYAFNAWVLDAFKQRAEHPNVLTDLGNGRTRYVSYESYYVGVVGLSVVLKGQLREAFERQGEDLKKYVEG
jgi:hypothetical protein